MGILRNDRAKTFYVQDVFAILSTGFQAGDGRRARAHSPAVFQQKARRAPESSSITVKRRAGLDR